MRIRRLKISKYKNVNDINLEFKSDRITLMVGQNGLGKSNLLEAIALIFRDLDLLDKEEEWEDWNYQGYSFYFWVLDGFKSFFVWINCWDGVFKIAKDESGIG